MDFILAPQDIMDSPSGYIEILKFDVTIKKNFNSNCSKIKALTDSHQISYETSLSISTFAH